MKKKSAERSRRPPAAGLDRRVERRPPATDPSIFPTSVRKVVEGLPGERTLVSVSLTPPGGISAPRPGYEVVLTWADADGGRTEEAYEGLSFEKARPLYEHYSNLLWRKR